MTSGFGIIVTALRVAAAALFAAFNLVPLYGIYAWGWDAFQLLVGSVVGGLYLRIVIMQLAIIFGAMASLRYGTMAPLIIVIALKTLIDLVTRLSAISGVSPAPLLSAAGTTTD